jgi:hypothetical protein
MLNLQEMNLGNQNLLGLIFCAPYQCALNLQKQDKIKIGDKEACRLFSIIQVGGLLCCAKQFIMSISNHLN